MITLWNISTILFFYIIILLFCCSCSVAALFFVVDVVVVFGVFLTKFNRSEIAWNKIKSLVKKIHLKIVSF